ncbi:unnamed protein product [Pleuronectes platessa]|uniref:Uncharacterized protein n=1 Tax=Pleuronectes platessa TaxID=8262 RepID=A0A9N7YT39_PLEPL|nr:unnamed protein product [Pleuronectes platessa]
MARPAASTTAFPAILEGPSNSTTTSAITPPASLAVPQVTQPAPTVPTLDTEGTSSPYSIEDFLIDDSEDGEEDDWSLTLPFEGDGPPLEEVDQATVLKKFQDDHLDGELGSTIPIRRKRILEGAMKAISRAALDQGKFYKAGQLVAWSVAHRGPCLKALDPSLFLLMCGQDPQLDQFDWHVLPDPEVQSKVERIQQCKTAGDLTALQQDLGDWIADCGVPGIFIMAAETSKPLTAKMINQFTDGMNAFRELWDIIKANWIAFLTLFTNMQEPLSKEAFKAIFLYTYSSSGSNNREAEEDTIYCWEMVLNMIQACPCRRFIKRATRVFSPPWSDLTLEGNP